MSLAVILWAGIAVLALVLGVHAIDKIRAALRARKDGRQ